MRNYRRSKSTTLPLGTISEGTLSPDDLIPQWLEALEAIRLSRADRTAVRRARVTYERFHADGFGDDLAEVCDELQTIAEGYAPDYAYVGTLEGDGACFGCWPCIDELESNARDRRYLDPNRPSSASVIKIDAGDPRPSAYRSPFDHLAEVTDHGNLTLYRRAGRRWIEVWGIV